MGLRPRARVELPYKSEKKPKFKIRGMRNRFVSCYPEYSLLRDDITYNARGQDRETWSKFPECKQIINEVSV